MRTVNDFAYVQIAIYGTPYRESAKATYKLMQEMGITPVLGIVIIVSGVCFLGCALGGGLAAAVGIAVAEWSGVAPLISTVRLHRPPNVARFRCRLGRSLHRNRLGVQLIAPRLAVAGGFRRAVLLHRLPDGHPVHGGALR